MDVTSPLGSAKQQRHLLNDVDCFHAYCIIHIHMNKNVHQIHFTDQRPACMHVNIVCIYIHVWLLGCSNACCMIHIFYTHALIRIFTTLILKKRHACMYVSMYVCMYVYTNVCIYTYRWVCFHAYCMIYIYIYIYIYVYIYIYIYYTYMHTHTDIHQLGCSPRSF